MASIGYLLMNEFHAEATTAKAENNFERGQAFDSAEGAVNNVLHGRTAAECLKLTRDALATRTNVTETEKLAFDDAILIIDLFADQYNLDLS